MATSTSLPAMRVPPQVPGWPLIGQILAFRRDPLGFLMNLTRRYGAVCQFQMRGRTVLLINDPDLIHQVLVTEADRFQKRQSRRATKALVIGNGLLNNDGASHQRQRRLMAPVFTPRAVAHYDEIMLAYTERVLADWTDGALIDVPTQMARLTLGISGATMFGADVLAEAADIGVALEILTRYVQGQSMALFRIPLNWPTPANRHFREALARVNTTVYRMIAERRAHSAGHTDLLAHLLAAQEDGRGMSDEQLRDEAMNLFLAGHETTGIALSWSLLLLAQHPAAYGRLRAEADQVLAGRPPTAADLPRLPYAMQVFKEALRLYPPIFVFGRQARVATHVGAYPVPAETEILISPYTLHRRADLFPDPERFDPERFTPEAEADRHRMAYLPFASGPRICIGNHFAQLEGAVVLAHLAQRVTLDLLPDQPVAPAPVYSLRPPPIQMRVRRH